MTQPPQWGAPPHRPAPGHGYHQPPQQHWLRQGPPPQQGPHFQPGPPPQQWPQPGPPFQPGPPPGWLPPKPSQLTLLAVLNWILAVGMLVIAAFVIMSFLMSGGTRRCAC